LACGACGVWLGQVPGLCPRSARSNVADVRGRPGSSSMPQIWKPQLGHPFAGKGIRVNASTSIGNRRPETLICPSHTNHLLSTLNPLLSREAWGGSLKRGLELPNDPSAEIVYPGAPGLQQHSPGLPAFRLPWVTIPSIEMNPEGVPQCTNPDSTTGATMSGLFLIRSPTSRDQFSSNRCPPAARPGSGRKTGQRLCPIHHDTVELRFALGGMSGVAT